MSSVKLSKKHEVNPSIAVCFWCGNETGEVILAGRLPKGVETPRNMIINYKFCEKCDQLREGQATIIEVTTTPLKRPTIQPNIWPTGRFWVVKKEMLNPTTYPDSIAMTTEEDARKLGLYGLEH